ncbi:MAG: hypothetical protein MZU91_08605 [Desulfosudis oleivorans]|nr:hypothetical protein [Desulfosudis oleivorans]
MAAFTALSCVAVGVGRRARLAGAARHAPRCCGRRWSCICCCNWRSSRMRSRTADISPGRSRSRRSTGSCGGATPTAGSLPLRILHAGAFWLVTALAAYEFHWVLGEPDPRRARLAAPGAACSCRGR